jgi:hypothetical protein
MIEVGSAVTDVAFVISQTPPVKTIEDVEMSTVVDCPEVETIALASISKPPVKKLPL